MAKKRRYSVPFITETIEIYEIDAESPAHAAFEAGKMQADPVAAPTHSHSTTRLGTTKLTIEDGSLAATVADQNHVDH